MKAMLEPRMAAARIHGADFGRQGELSVPDLMTASSHGCRIRAVDAQKLGYDAGDFHS
jgi:hypothetical protein